MQPLLLDLHNSLTTLHSKTDAGAIFLPEQPLDVYDSLHAVTGTEAERDDVERPQ